MRGVGINLSQESNRVTVRGLPENTSDRGQSWRCIAVRPVCDTHVYSTAWLWHRDGATTQETERREGSAVGEGFIGGLALVYIVSNGFAQVSDRRRLPRAEAQRIRKPISKLVPLGIF